MSHATASVALTAALVLGGTSSGLAPPQPQPGPPAPLGYTTYGAPTEACRPSDRRIDSISGLVVADGATWVQDDRAGALWLLDRTCRPVRQADLRAAGRLTDTEDLAATADGSLWVADTGGNRVPRVTPSVVKVPAAGGPPVRYTFRYPDGPHDAEALLISPDAAQLLLVTKSTSGVSTVYRPVRPLRPGTVTPLRPVATVRLSAMAGRNPGPGAILVTGGAVSPDGLHLALRTYNEAWEYDAADGRLVEALRDLPRKVALPETKQGEAISYTSDGKAFLVAGEQLAPVYRVSIDRPRYAPTEQRASSPESGRPHDRGAVATVLVAGAVVCLLLLIGALLTERRRSRRDPGASTEPRRKLLAALRSRS